MAGPCQDFFIVTMLSGSYAGFAVWLGDAVWSYQSAYPGSGDIRRVRRHPSHGEGKISSLLAHLEPHGLTEFVCSGRIAVTLDGEYDNDLT